MDKDEELQKALEEALEQLELDFADNFWDDDFALIDHAGSLPDIPDDTYCQCKEPEIVVSEAYGEKFDYCRACKKERK